VPRLVNIISHKSLLLLYGEGGKRLEVRHVRAAALDTPASSHPRRWWQWPRLRLSRLAK
jgi:MSHA biogenesis protein MshM